MPAIPVAGENCGYAGEEPLSVAEVTPGQRGSPLTCPWGSADGIYHIYCFDWKPSRKSALKPCSTRREAGRRAMLQPLSSPPYLSWLSDWKRSPITLFPTTTAPANKRWKAHLFLLSEIFLWHIRTLVYMTITCKKCLSVYSTSVNGFKPI